MASSEQMGLEFDTGDAPPLPAAAPRKARAPRTPKAASAPDTDWPALADRLAAHPDYRVLRRLVPTLAFAPATGPTRTLLVLDTETTGLESARDRVIELALLRVDVDTATGRPAGPVQVYDGLEDPGRPIPAAITDITGITDAMVAGQRLDEARVAELLQGVDLVVAHNAGFDRPFVEARLPAFAQVPWACSFADLDWKALGQGSAKLESLAAACGWFYDAHRAETDCHALLAVLAQPQGRFGPAQARAAAETPTGLQRLLQAGGQVQWRLQATGAPFDAKDALKARGYRWDGTQRVWGTLLRSQEALQGELDWLLEAVYAGRSTRVRVEALDAQTRYSGRGGLCTMHPVGPGGMF
jgi:DNA polymerase-3 subunit epsilon